MPTKIYFQGSASVLVKGDTEQTAIYYGPPIIRWFRRLAKAVATNDHELVFKKSAVLCYEYQPDAEYQAVLDKQKSDAEAAATMSHCRRCGKTSPREASFCSNCSAPLVKKEEPRRIIPVGGN
jgi:hypothetical protein